MKFGSWLKDLRITMSLVLNGSFESEKMKMVLLSRTSLD
jgi:hypothetical protein